MNENTDTHAPADADMEQDSRDATLPANEVETIPSPCRIHFHSVRKRLADLDGLSGKAVLDGIVHSGILSDDSPKYVSEIRHTQSKGSVEETVVTLEWGEE